jgi:hypothetical protein
VGRRFDGLSTWLDGFDMNASHEPLLAYGKQTETRPSEILRALRSAAEAEILREQVRGFIGVSATKVLLAYLCKLQERYADETRLQLEGAEALRHVLLLMWSEYEPDGPPYRSEQSEQFSREHPDSLQALSRLLARHSEKAWMGYRRSDACPRLGWEDGYSRVAHKVPSRVDRLKSLGNAVVPQIPQIIGEAILRACA